MKKSSNINQATMHEVTYKGEHVGLVAATPATAIQVAHNMLRGLDRYQGQVIDSQQITVSNKNHHKYQHMM